MTDPSTGGDSATTVTAFYAQTNFKPTPNSYDKFFIPRGFPDILPGLQKITAESEIDKENITYYVEENVLLNLQFKEYLNAEVFGNKSAVFVIGKDRKTRRLAYFAQDGQTRRLLNNDEKIENLFSPFDKLNDPSNLFFLRQKQGFKPVAQEGDYFFVDPNALEDFRRYENEPVSNGSFRILSFFADAAEIVKQKTNEVSVEFDLQEEKFKGRTQEQDLQILENNLKIHAGTTVFVMGHLDEKTGDYLVENAGSKPYFGISVGKLNEMAATHGIELIHLGCKSTALLDRGTIGVVYSKDVATRLTVAIQAKTLGEFLRAMASEDLMLVIDKIFIDATRRHVEISVLKNKKSQSKGAGRGKGGKKGASDGRDGGNNGGGGGNNNGKGPNAGGEFVEVGKITLTLPLSLSTALISSPTPTPTPTSPSSGSEGKILIFVIGIGGIVIAFFVIRKIMRKDDPLTAGNDGGDSEIEKIDITCPFCRQVNRVIQEKARLAICGGCKKPIF